MAVKNRHYLPYRGEFDGKQQVVYTRQTSLSGMQSLLILPLAAIIIGCVFGALMETTLMQRIYQKDPIL